jgi:hypothetical protein
MKSIRRVLSQISRLLVRCWQTYLAIGPKAKFPNVPDRLTAVVRDRMIEFEKTEDRNLLYLEAAGYVILEYLQIRCFDERAHPFWGGRQVNAQGDLWYGFPLRVILIGETLFLLRNCSGFSEICFRLKERDFRASYYEMLAAKLFIRTGFDIQMKPEKQSGPEQKKLGEHFDFTAVRRRVAINAEVTALQEQRLLRKNSDKRTWLEAQTATQRRPRHNFLCHSPSMGKTQL